MAAKGKDRLEIAVKEFIKGVFIERVERYTWYQALLDAGYKQSYAHSHCTNLRRRAQPAIDKEKDAIYKENRYNLKDWENALRELHKECVINSDRTNTKGCIDIGIKLNGGFIERKLDLTNNTSDINDDDRKIMEDYSRQATIKIAKGA